MTLNKIGFPLPHEVIRKILTKLKFQTDGLIQAITQEVGTLEVLMMAWMNENSIKKTLSTGQVVYWSRSRKKLWRKGEVSGQSQKLIELRWDCDADTLLVLVDQLGVAFDCPQYDKCGCGS